MTTLLQAIKVLALELRSFFRHSLAQIKLVVRGQGDSQKLNIGCGANYKTGWVNIDQCSGVDYRFDIRRKFPFRSNSAEIVYSEHVFEHLEYPREAQNYLTESLRVLKVTGRLSLGVPDSAWPVSAYVNGDQRYFELASKLWHPASCTTRMHHLNFHFRQGKQHKYSYDFETLREVVEAAGFTNVNRREFDPSLDSELRREGTIYLEATKP